MVQEVKSPVKNLVHIYICVKFLTLLGAPYIYIYNICRLRVIKKRQTHSILFTFAVHHSQKETLVSDNFQGTAAAIHVGLASFAHFFW
jgi:hypothetical protein